MQVESFVAIKIIYVESPITINISESVFVTHKSQIKPLSLWTISTLAIGRRLARALPCDARDCLTPGVVALHIPQSGTTITVSLQKSTQSCYNVLCCVAFRCVSLRCIILYYIILYYIILYYIILYYIILYYIILYYIILYYIILYYIILYYIILYYIIIMANEVFFLDITNRIQQFTILKFNMKYKLLSEPNIWQFIYWNANFWHFFITHKCISEGTINMFPLGYICFREYVLSKWYMCMHIWRRSHIHEHLNHYITRLNQIGNKEAYIRRFP